MDEDPAAKKKAVATHTSYLSCCSFTCSDYQVILCDHSFFIIIINFVTVNNVPVSVLGFGALKYQFVFFFLDIINSFVIVNI